MVSKNSRSPALSPDWLLPDLLRVRPETRAVFDRYGLRGCGGPLGPHETIRFFARAHGVDEVRLLAELNEVIAAKAAGRPVPHPLAPRGADTIYRRYFVGAIALVLTAGASWGAWLLWTIALGGSFRAISINAVNAHGEAQIFGWVGLFVMGFAYQAFPRFWQTELVAPRLAAENFAVMVAGLVLRTMGIASASVWEAGLPLAMAGGGLEAIAVTVFALQILATLRRSHVRLEPYLGFILAGLGWFVMSSWMSLWHTWTTLTALTERDLIWYVATYQAPLRDLQIHGLALFMILGVSLRMFPGLFELPAVSARRAWWALDLLVTALAGEVGLFLLYRWTGNRTLTAALPVAWLMLAVGVALIVLPWKLWRPLPVPERSGKFVRAAHGWLAISLVMLLAMPIYLIAGHLRFSHAYLGATRHAITVGFVSLMIMGMAAKVVPTLNGVDPKRLSCLYGPFWLVNAGCLIRVVLQVLTDWTDVVYPFLGASGTLEVAGLAWWGFGLVQMIRHGAGSPALAPQVVTIRPVRIEGQHFVANVLEWFPRTEDVFVRFGFTALKQPLLRQTIARRVTIAQAASLHGVPLAELLQALNAATATGPPTADRPSSFRNFIPTGVCS